MLPYPHPPVHPQLPTTLTVNCYINELGKRQEFQSALKFSLPWGDLSDPGGVGCHGTDASLSNNIFVDFVPHSPFPSKPSMSQ